MARSKAVAACAVGTMAACASSAATAFTIAPGFAGSAPPSPSQLLRGSTAQSPVEQEQTWGRAASAGLTLAATAGLACVASSRRAVRKARASENEAVAIIKASDENILSKTKDEKIAVLRAKMDYWELQDTYESAVPFGQPQMELLLEPFAGGMTGSEYHGWGKYEFDPAKLSYRYPEHLPWYREAELKHGRVAMLAFLGFVVPDFLRIPLDLFQAQDLDMVSAHNKLIGPGFGEGPMWWLLAFCGIVESNRFKQLGLGFEKLTIENAGNCDFGKAFLPKTQEGITQMKIKELKNGRLAMLAVSGILTGGTLFNAHHFPFLP